MDAEIKSQALAAKMLRGLCLGYVVLFNSWLALACIAMSWESFYPRYRVPQIASGLKSAAFALMFLVIALGVAFGHRWARWVSIALGTLGLCFSVFSFWDGYLRIKSKYSGEESSEVFGAIVFSVISLLVLAAMFAPAAKSYFDAKAVRNTRVAAPLDPTS